MMEKGTLRSYHWHSYFSRSPPVSVPVFLKKSLTRLVLHKICDSHAIYFYVLMQTQSFVFFFFPFPKIIVVLDAKRNTWGL
jgi:hypothetical protein